MISTKGEDWFNGLGFHKTCFACPEQYDVFDGLSEQVGDVRLRHGCLQARLYPQETVIYEVYLDNISGCFADDVSREYHLTEISNRIKTALEANRS